MTLLQKILLVLCLVVLNSCGLIKRPFEYQEIPFDIPIPYGATEENAIFEACQEVAKDKQNECFIEQLEQHVKTHLKYPRKALAKRIEGVVNVHFRINTDGSVSIMAVHGSNKILEEEAAFIINSLPCLIPAKINGQAVPFFFTYPITFKLPDSRK